MVSLWPKRIEITAAKRAFEHIIAKSADRNATSAVGMSVKTQRAQKEKELREKRINRNLLTLKHRKM